VLAEAVAVEEEPQAIDEVVVDDNLFFRAVGRFPLLTADEEVALAKRIEAGDAEARTQMILSNLRLVIFAARRFQGHGLPLLDLIQEGTIGLATAVSKFDWRRGRRFSTYAMWWIRQACQYAIYDQGRTIRLPAHVIQRRDQLGRVRAELEASLQRSPRLAELASLTDLDERQAQEALEAAEVDSSLDRQLGDKTVVDLVGSEEPEMLAGAIHDDRQRSLNRLVSELPDRERCVVTHRYGLAGSREMTQRELGAELGISRDAVALIERKALQRLRKIARRDSWLREEALAR
jgi:RNA polymerase primary sigma factor